MRQFEYRIENIQFQASAPHEQQILTVLNEFGEQGWRVCSIDALPKRQSLPHSLRVVFERRVDKARRNKTKRTA